MALTTGDMSGFRNGFDRLFNDLERSLMGGDMSSMMPSMMGSMMPMMGSSTRGMMRMDMWEKDNMYHCMMDMPGCKKEDCNISVDEQKNMMTVTCERKDKCDPKECEIIIKECPTGKMSRSIMFPDTADLSKAECKMEDGVMCCCIPRRESPKGKQLSIK